MRVRRSPIYLDVVDIANVRGASAMWFPFSQVEPHATPRNPTNLSQTGRDRAADLLNSVRA